MFGHHFRLSTIVFQAHEKKNQFLFQLPVYWGHKSLEPLSTHFAWEPPSYSIPSLFEICMWPSLYFQSVYPTQGLMGLPRISVTDPTASIHRGRIVLSANSILIVFWYQNPGYSLLPPASGLISFPWPLKVYATPPLQPFPKLTPCCSSAHLGAFSLPFKVVFLPPHRAFPPWFITVPRTTAQT